MFACGFGAIGTAHATNTDISGMANVIYIEPFSAMSNTSDYIVSIKMKNAAVISAFQLDMSLPEGVTPATYDSGIIKCALATNRLGDGDDHSISVNQQLDGSYRVLCTSANNLTFTGTDGEIATLRVNIASGMAVGDYPITITYQKLNESEMNNFYEPGEVETTMTITGVNDGRVHFDEASSTLPTYTAGEKGNVSMIRTIKANEWNTIVLPFTLTQDKAKSIFGNDVELAEFSGFEVDYGDDDENVIPFGITINLSTYSLGARKPLTGGKPFLIRTKQNITSFEADEVTLVDVVTNVSKTDEFGTPGIFTGSLIKTVIPVDGLFITDNQFWYSAGTTNIKAFRCWFELDAVLDKETDFSSRISFSFNNSEASGISETNREATTDGRYYDLQGRRVKIPGKGLYVRDGKKTVIR